MIALLSLLLCPALADPPTVSLEQAIAAAGAHPSVLAADRSRDAAWAGVGVARPGRLPAFNVSGNVLYYDDEQTFSLVDSGESIDCSAFPDSFKAMCEGFATPTVVREQLTTSLTVRATLPLTGQVTADRQIAAAKANARAADAVEQAAEADARYSVEDAWYTALEAEQQLAIANAQVASLQVRVDAATAAVDAGSLIRSDLLLASIALSQARQAVLQLTALRDASYRRLGLAMGKHGEPVRPDGQLTAPLRSPPEVDHLLEMALAHRPDLIAADERAKAARASAQATSWMRLPTLNAMGAYTHQTGQGVFSEPDVAYVGASLDWPVFTWGKAYNAAKAADGTADAAALQVELAKSALDVEIHSRADALNTAIAGLAVSETVVTQAEENLHIQEARQSAGSATMQEVLDAELTLVKARSSRASAEFAARRAEAALERAVGGDPWQS